MFKQMKLVAGQVYRTKIKTPSFWLAVLTPLLIPIVMLLSVLLSPKQAMMQRPNLQW